MDEIDKIIAESEFLEAAEEAEDETEVILVGEDAPLDYLESLEE